MDSRHISEYYTDLAKQVIDAEPDLDYLKTAPVTIVYLESSHAKKGKGKLILGQCEKVQEKNKWGIPADFTITIFEPNVAGMTEAVDIYPIGVSIYRTSRYVPYAVVMYDAVGADVGFDEKHVTGVSFE